MTDLEFSSRPRLAAGCRWATSGETRMLLYPEGALRLQSTAVAILERCDGHRTFEQIVQELQRVYNASEPDRVRQDVISFLNLLHEKRLVDF